jgi:hypothetical protein
VVAICWGMDPPQMATGQSIQIFNREGQGSTQSHSGLQVARCQTSTTNHHGQFRIKFYVRKRNIELLEKIAHISASSSSKDWSRRPRVEAIHIMHLKSPESCRRKLCTRDGGGSMDQNAEASRQPHRQGTSTNSRWRSHQIYNKGRPL